MTKKDKKKPQQNLSLKERLEKHWNNRNWSAFTSLFLRDREASMRTPWASRWDDALYNALTSAFFVEKDLKNVAVTLDFIRAERGMSGISPLLCDCADVVSDFLNAHENGVAAKPSPLLSEARLPSPYLALRQKYESFAALKRKKSPQNKAEQLVQKLATQYGKLGRAKTATPYTTWKKIAKDLKDATQKMEYADIFHAVHDIVSLVYEVVFKGRGENALRDPMVLQKHSAFRDIPKNQNHPVVRVLWEYFCQTGEQKYGKDWGGIVRVLQLSFMKRPDLEQIQTQYKRLTKSRYSEAFLEDILQPALLTPGSQWTDQEHYILRTFAVSSFGESFSDEIDSSEFAHYLESFKVLGELGRKWRPQAPWSKMVSLCFEKMIFRLPRRLFSVIAQWNLPSESMTPMTLFYLALTNSLQGTAIKEAIASKAPLRLSEEKMRYVAFVLLQEDLSRRNVRSAKALLGGDDYVTFCLSLVRKAFQLSVEDVEKDGKVSQQFWFSLRRDALEELADNLPSDTLEHCFCRLYLDGRPMSVSNDPAKIKAFFNAKASTAEFSSLLWRSLSSWPQMPPDFLVRLFKKIYPQILEEKKTDDAIWKPTICAVRRTRPKAARDEVVRPILDLMLKDKKNKNKSLKGAISFLQHLLTQTDADLAKKRKERDFFDDEDGEFSFKDLRDLFFQMSTRKKGRKKGPSFFDDFF